MVFRLFPDQTYLVDQALELTNKGQGPDNVLITSPSASGKTYMIAGLLRKLVKTYHFKPSEILIISPTYEVADQCELASCVNVSSRFVANTWKISTTTIFSLMS